MASGLDHGELLVVQLQQALFGHLKPVDLIGVGRLIHGGQCVRADGEFF
jgi:hypothetical protein